MQAGRIGNLHGCAPLHCRNTSQEAQCTYQAATTTWASPGHGASTLTYGQTIRLPARQRPRAWTYAERARQEGRYDCCCLIHIPDSRGNKTGPLDQHGYMYMDGAVDGITEASGQPHPVSPTTTRLAILVLRLQCLHFTWATKSHVIVILTQVITLPFLYRTCLRPALLMPSLPLQSRTFTIGGSTCYIEVVHHSDHTFLQHITQQCYIILHLGWLYGCVIQHLPVSS